MDPTDWPNESDWVWKGPVAPPAAWGRPGVVLAFNVSCAGCVSRAIPFMKRLHAEHGARLRLASLHTAHGHRVLPRDAVAPEVERFASSFARLPFAVALDLDGARAARWGAEGTPHWFVFDADGALVRSIFGSQDNATTRLAYLVEELLEAAP
ncbi:MAG: hypothetical protein U5K81_01185 [Trueperaceae bacterium]|nr:hypothetical protein [Trueperaceae bacterium]